MSLAKGSPEITLVCHLMTMATSQTRQTEKGNAFLILFFNTFEGLKGSQYPGLENQNDKLTVDPEVVQELLLKMDSHKLRVLIEYTKELAGVILKHLYEF